MELSNVADLAKNLAAAAEVVRKQQRKQQRLRDGYTAERRGHERSALVKRGSETVAEVFTDIEPGDQHRTVALFAAAPAMLDALHIAREHVKAAAEADLCFARQQEQQGMHGNAAECRKAHDMRLCALAVIDSAIAAATSN